MLLGISVPAPPPPRPTLVCRHQTVILVKYTNKCIRKFFFNSLLTRPKFIPVTRTGKVDGMVSNLQQYPYVTIKNYTPYATVAPYARTAQPTFTEYGVLIGYKSRLCRKNGYVDDAIASGGTWTSSSRGACFVSTIRATLTIPAGYRKHLKCTRYKRNPGDTYSIFSIIMKGDDACCVLSSNETQKCP